MDRHNIITSCRCNQVCVQPVGIERSYRRHQFSHCLKTYIQCLVCRQFILCKFTTPETFTIQTNVPIGQIIIHKVGNQTSSLCRLIFIITGIYLFYQRVQHRQNPTVDFRTFRHRHIRFLIFKSVNIGIKRKERIGII